MPLPVPNESPTLADLVNDAIAMALYRLRTSQPGHVVSYDPKTNTATIQPAVQEGDYDDEGNRVTTTPVPISGCPVLFYGNQDFWISTPITPGTPGFIITSSASLDAWSGSKAGDIVDPKNDERHHISNSIFVPGIRPPKSAIGSAPGTAQDALVINGSKIQLGSQSASTAVALQTAINSVVSAFMEPTIAAAIYAYGLVPGAPTAAALVSAVNTFFLTHSTAGASKVVAE